MTEPTNHRAQAETAAEFLASRVKWLRVEAVDRPDGRWDVRLRIDGIYSMDWDKDHLVEYFREQILAVLATEGIELALLQDWRH